LELAVAYASERRQFGQHIGSFQAIQHLCAEMLQQVELARAGLHYALWAQDAGEPGEAHRAAVMCKAFVAETFPQIGANAIQIFGGAGFTWEYDIQLYYKRLLSTQMTWGGSEVWLEELATLVIDRDAPPLTIN
jgi:alkylation response protein AidB-like acyl-CoA dehydrogenase